MLQSLTRWSHRLCRRKMRLSVQFLRFPSSFHPIFSIQLLSLLMFWKERRKERNFRRRDSNPRLHIRVNTKQVLTPKATVPWHCIFLMCDRNLFWCNIQLSLLGSGVAQWSAPRFQTCKSEVQIPARDKNILTKKEYYVMLESLLCNCSDSCNTQRTLS